MGKLIAFLKECDLLLAYFVDNYRLPIAVFLDKHVDRLIAFLYKIIASLCRPLYKIIAFLCKPLYKLIDFLNKHGILDYIVLVTVGVPVIGYKLYEGYLDHLEIVSWLSTMFNIDSAEYLKHPLWVLAGFLVCKSIWIIIDLVISIYRRLKQCF